MNIFGLSITRASRQKALSPVDSKRGWWPVIRESFAGAWQRNIEIKRDNVLSHHAVFACQTLIASDIAKMRVKLVELGTDGVWKEIASPAFSPVLRKPNHYQTRIQFWESWMLSKLSSGNTYALKQRDNRGVVVRLYILAPDLVTPMVSGNGEVFYELRADHLSGLPERIVVPAREIIHDRFNCLFHPLVGLSPIFAAGLPAVQGLAIQKDQTLLFKNGARPSGILTAPGEIGDDTANRLKEQWEANYGGENIGKVAVLGDGLKFEAMAVKAIDAQVVEQMKWNAEVVCSTYHVPPYKIGAGQMPTVNNVQSLNLEYYTQCLQVLIEAAELCLDEGLGMDSEKIGTEFDLDGLLRMDTASQVEVLGKLKGIATLNEARRRIDLPPTDGGDTIYLQHQDHSLAAIAARDAQLVEDARTPPPAPANDDNLEKLAENMKGHVARAVDSLAADTKALAARLAALEERPAPERGEKGEAGEPGARGPAGERGERGEKGDKGDPGERGDPGVTGPQGPDGPQGAPGRDGRDGAAGRDGEKGIDGRDGVDGKDGAPGRDGKDGFSLKHFDVSMSAERTMLLSFEDEEQRFEVELGLPYQLYRGVWKEGEYTQGDSVTWGGSVWVLMAEKSELRPDAPDSGWLLAVKKGRDGKDAPKC